MSCPIEEFTLVGQRRLMYPGRKHHLSQYYPRDNVFSPILYHSNPQRTGPTKLPEDNTADIAMGVILGLILLVLISLLLK